MIEKTPTLSCRTSQRQHAVRSANAKSVEWNGVDYVTYQNKVLEIQLLCPLESVDSLQFQVVNERGGQIADEVLQPFDSLVYFCENELEVGRYHFKVLNDGFDPRLSSVQFDVFEVTTDVDPRSTKQCQAAAKSALAEANYLAKDFQSFRRLILDRLAVIMPDWQETHAADLGMTLVELLAYVGDHLSYYQDAVATEAYLGTSRSRISIRRHARLVDYTLHEGCNARAFLHLRVTRDFSLDVENAYFITRPQHRDLVDKHVLAQHELNVVSSSEYVGFEALPTPAGHFELQEQSCLNWNGFLSLLISTSSPLLQSLLDCLSGNLWERLEKFLSGNYVPISGGMLLEVIVALKRGMNHELFSQRFPDMWTSDVCAAARNVYQRAPEKLVALNATLLQLAFPQYFAFSRSVDLLSEAPLTQVITAESQPVGVPLYAAHNEIQFYTWDEAECCLPVGATSATLVDQDARPYSEMGGQLSEANRRLMWPRLLRLKPGDFLLLQEVKGPRTGQAADANPAHRQVVRLTNVNQSIDPVQMVPIVEIQWHADDALTFPLCLSSRSTSDCKLVSGVSIARGNIVLADHGITVESPEHIGVTGVPAAKQACCDSSQCRSSDLPKRPQSFYLHNEESVTHASKVALDVSAAHIVRQRAEHALPALSLIGIPVDPEATAIGIEQPRAPLITPEQLSDQNAFVGRIRSLSKSGMAALLDLLPPQHDDIIHRLRTNAPRTNSSLEVSIVELMQRTRDAMTWDVKQHLMDSHAQDQHVTVEFDNERRASVRTGTGREGKRPLPETHFFATYRMGNGTVGNVGVNKLNTLVYRDRPVTGIESISNPLAATGGTEPETNQHAKQFAPQAFRSIKRAVLAEDYREILLRDFASEVQQARVSTHQVAQRTVIQVVIDPFQNVRDIKVLKKRILQHLTKFARMGHEIHLGDTKYVGLKIRLQVKVTEGYLRGDVHRELLALFGTGTFSDGRAAVFHPDNLTFGGGIYISRIISLAGTIPGVTSVRVTELRRIKETPEDSAKHLEAGVLQLADDEIPVVSDAPGQSEQRSIQIQLEGGR